MFGGWSFVKTINFIALTKPDHVQTIHHPQGVLPILSHGAPRSGQSYPPLYRDRRIHWVVAHGLVGWPRLVDGDRAGLRLWLCLGGPFFLRKEQTRHLRLSRHEPGVGFHHVLAYPYRSDREEDGGGQAESRIGQLCHSLFGEYISGSRHAGDKGLRVNGQRP